MGIGLLAGAPQWADGCNSDPAFRLACFAEKLQIFWAIRSAKLLAVFRRKAPF